MTRLVTNSDIWCGPVLAADNQNLAIAHGPKMTVYVHIILSDIIQRLTSPAFPMGVLKPEPQTRFWRGSWNI